MFSKNTSPLTARPCRCAATPPSVEPPFLRSDIGSPSPKTYTPHFGVFAAQHPLTRKQELIDM